MRPRRSRSTSPGHWPATLRQLIEAAALECPRGHAEALMELTALAFRKVPARGLFDPAARGEDDMFAAIEKVAHAHLGLGGARAASRKALDEAALDLERRDHIERATLQVQTASDTAYFYAGLAFGLVSACLYRTGS
jgi:hypothetical protein